MITNSCKIFGIRNFNLLCLPLQLDEPCPILGVFFLFKIITEYSVSKRVKILIRLMQCLIWAWTVSLYSIKKDARLFWGKNDSIMYFNRKVI